MVIAGFQRGIKKQIPHLRKQLKGLTHSLPVTTEWEARGIAATASARVNQNIRLDVTGSDEEMKRLVRKLFRVDGRGFSQIATR
jgi:hypothetical protein